MRKIIPTVFAHNKKEFDERFKKLIELKRDLQIDFMDGKFVGARGIGLKDVPNLKKYLVRFEAHLMVMNPEKWISGLKKKGFYKIIFHVESKKNDNEISKVIELIKKNNLECWISINPNTDIKRIADLLKKVDGVLFMGVYPGKEKQKFVNSVLGKIKKLRKINRKIKIQVDGGVNLITIGKLGKIGVNYVNSGSFVSGAEDSRKALKELERKFR